MFPLPSWEGMKGRGIFASSPPPQPSPIRRERGYKNSEIDMLSPFLGSFLDSLPLGRKRVSAPIFSLTIVLVCKYN
jgi:hypothetical protein